ncbi:MAG: enoyl-CoA hydratase/isomerase family protein [Rhodospirillaceae bacterium]|nr:MAG: enoyl-CoA hydratase/isomerase family protein [Rhodospirillaceae bacterium]
MQDDIVLERRGGWGVATFNRPAALNALTRQMCVALDEALTAWADDPSVIGVVAHGAGDKAFCAGGDVRAVRAQALEDMSEARRFFADEYAMNRRLFNFPKPYVALIDGICMGGGVGVSWHGRYRVAGPKTLWAMPETGIGFFPDVGVSWQLARLQPGLGAWLALTGARLGAADCFWAGVATHHCPNQNALFSELLAVTAADAVETVLRKHHVDPGESPVAEQAADIARLFCSADLETIAQALETHDAPWAEAARAALSTASPTALAVTLRHLHETLAMPFELAILQDYRLACRMLEHGDFLEGVRALLVDKDRNPRWQPLGEVDRFFR